MCNCAVSLTAVGARCQLHRSQSQRSYRSETYLFGIEYSILIGLMVYQVDSPLRVSRLMARDCT